VWVRHVCAQQTVVLQVDSLSRVLVLGEDAIAGGEAVNLVAPAVGALPMEK
jgi:hypothetical protein